jgi:hypothetical protein
LQGHAHSAESTRRLPEKGTFTNESIYAFAEQIGIGPGIVVGRLQHDGVLARHQGNAFKQNLGSTFRDEG